jgi:hypothetical protein
MSILQLRFCLMLAALIGMFWAEPDVHAKGVHYEDLEAIRESVDKGDMPLYCGRWTGEHELIG